MQARERSNVGDGVVVQEELLQPRQLCKRCQVGNLVSSQVQPFKRGQLCKRRKIANAAVFQAKLLEAGQPGQRGELQGDVAAQKQGSQRPQAGDRRSIANVVVVEIEPCEAGGQIQPCQAADALAGAVQRYQSGHLGRTDGCPRRLAQGIFHHGAQLRIFERAQIGDLIVGVVAHAIEVCIRPLVGIARECVFFVFDTIVVVVRIGVVAEAVAIGIAPIPRVVGQGIDRIDKSVAVAVRQRVEMGCYLETQGIQGAGGVGAVRLVDGSAARHSRAIGIRVGKDRPTRVDLTVAHDGAVVGVAAFRFSQVMPARPGKRTVGFPLAGRVRQPHDMPEFVCGHIGGDLGTNGGMRREPVSPVAGAADAGATGRATAAPGPIGCGELQGKIGAHDPLQRLQIFRLTVLRLLEMDHPDGAQPDVGVAVREQALRHHHDMVHARVGVAVVLVNDRVVVERNRIDCGCARLCRRVIGRGARNPLVGVADAVAVAVGQQIDIACRIACAGRGDGP